MAPLVKENLKDLLLDDVADGEGGNDDGHNNDDHQGGGDGLDNEDDDGQW